MKGRGLDGVDYVKLASRVMIRDGDEFPFDLFEFGGSYLIFLYDELIYESGVEISEEVFYVLCEFYIMGYDDGYGNGETSEYMRNH